MNLVYLSWFYRRYYYYHCSFAFGCRFKAEIVNDAILNELKKYSLAPEFKELCTSILIDIYNQETNGARDDRKSVLKQIDEQNDKLRKARELMLTSRIEPEEYTLIKREIEVMLNKLEAKLADFAVNPVRLDDFLIKAVDIICDIAILYQGADNEGKRAIIGSMFPEKLHFDGHQHRTNRINEVAKCIYQISSSLRDKKERARTDKSALPTWVPPPGLEP